MIFRIVKLLLRALLRFLYGVQVRGMEHYQAAGKRVLIVANHTSLLDGLLLYAWLPETPTFAINTEIATRPLFRPFLRFVDLFTMDPTSPLSVKSLIRFVRSDRKAVIFPEGRITVTGIPMKVYEGPGLVADKAGATILPIAIDGAQYSPFSYMKGHLRIRWFPRIRMYVLPPQMFQIDPLLQGHARRKAAGREMQRLVYHLFYQTYDYDKTLYNALVEAAELHGPSHKVIEDLDRNPLSYRQLLTRVLVLAPLIESHSRPGESVAVLLPNVSATAVVFFAMQAVGRVPAMLNFTSGAQALLRACETAGVGVIYTSRRFVAAAGLEEAVDGLAARFRIIYLEDLRGSVSTFARLRGWLRARRPARFYRKHCPRRDPDSPAVVLFTSGSEGTPKGVVLSHTNLLSNYAQVRCYIDFRRSDLFFTCLPLFHSFGLNAALLMPLLGGSRNFLYPSPLHYRVIPELIYELGATILFGTGTFFKGYARYAHPFDFRSLRYVVAGAEKLRDEVLQQWMDKFGIRILQGYGVTEASPVIAANTPVTNKAGTVGQLLPGMEYYLAPVPGIHEGGRLVVRGPNVMLGYLRHGSEDGFSPPSAERGEGWYDTGDIADVDEEGFLTILGRAKRFAKIGGEMISLGAVEELALEAWPDSNHAAVTLPDEKKGEKIILVTDYPSATRKEIQERARLQGVGELYVPRKVLLAEELPTLGNGKTDYITLTRMALEEEGEGSGWIRKITKLVTGERNEGAGAPPAAGRMNANPSRRG